MSWEREAGREGGAEGPGVGGREAIWGLAREGALRGLCGGGVSPAGGGGAGLGWFCTSAGARSGFFF